jgi:hypothetical protein
MIIVCKKRQYLEELAKKECVFLVNGTPRPKTWVAKEGDVVVIIELK